MIADESGFICVCGQWVDGIMHGECRALMSSEDYEHWTSKIIFVSNREGNHV